jgi:hypothetical protein
VFMPYVPLRRTARGIPAGEAPPVPGPAREAATA